MGEMPRQRYGSARCPFLPNPLAVAWTTCMSETERACAGRAYRVDVSTPKNDAGGKALVAYAGYDFCS